MRRRDWLKASAGLLLLRDALAAGRVEKGVYRVRGEATLNGVAAKPGMDVRSGDRILTNGSSEIVFVVNRDAMMVRSHSAISVLADGFRLVTGAALSVFAPGEPKELRTPAATIGIRGTAVYLEAGDERTYVCTCYGIAEIVSTADPSVREIVHTHHHDQPRFVYLPGAPRMMTKAPVMDHTDAELFFLESLVGRRPPFKKDTPY